MSSENNGVKNNGVRSLYLHSTWRVGTRVRDTRVRDTHTLSHTLFMALRAAADAERYVIETRHGTRYTQAALRPGGVRRCSFLERPTPAKWMSFAVRLAATGRKRTEFG